MIVPRIGKKPTIQRLTSGSGTYTTPAGVFRLVIRMAGGGGGGGGGGTAGATNGTVGTASTFGGTLLVANGGEPGRITNDQGGNGGTVTVNAPAVTVVALTGGKGQGGATSSGVALSLNGGPGGHNLFAGGGAQGPGSSPGGAGIPNTGGGAAGGSSMVATGVDAGSGGGAGGYIEAIIDAPNATYAYVIGPGGAGGNAGTSGTVGGLGGSGVIIVEEHYN